MENKHELEFTDSLFSVIPIINFQGVCIEKIIGGYRLLGEKVRTVSEVKELLENSRKNIEKSIANKNGNELIGQ